MRLSMWTYPWDILDLGADAVLGELADIGMNSVSLATSYHAGRFLQPRSPQRKAYFPEDGTIYFQPTAALWHGAVIQPKLADVIRDGGDVLDNLVRRRDAGGLAVSCWTVCLHNTRLGMLHPEAVTRNAFGDPNFYSLCPSNEAARAYARTLVADVTRRYRPDRLELETVGFMGFAHEFHHEKDGVGLTPEDDFLLSLCFCQSCVARAARAGVDARAAQRTVAGWILETCERAVPEPRWADFPACGPDAFRPFPEVFAFIKWRFEPVTSLVAELRDAADPATQLVLIDLRDGWLGGCDLAAIGAACDGAILCAYAMAPDQVTRLMASGRAALGERFLGAGFRLFYPEMTDPASLREKLGAALGAGVDGLNFYNYGLVPGARLNWVAQALQGLR